MQTPGHLPRSLPDLLRHYVQAIPFGPDQLDHIVRPSMAVKTPKAQLSIPVCCTQCCAAVCCMARAAMLAVSLP